MPFINCQTNTIISSEQARNVKSRLGKAIELIPGKTEELLMIALVDQCYMAYQGKDDTELAFVNLRILAKGHAVVDYSPITQSIITIINEELGIPADNIYVSFSEFPAWGCKVGDSYIL